MTSASCVITQSFGTRERGTKTPCGAVNELLAQRALVLAQQFDIPVAAQEEIADAMPKTGADLRIAGDPSSMGGQELDSWEVLEQARQNTAGIDTNRPLVVAQAHHVARFALQASLQGLAPTLPPDLPTDFAPNSDQWCTRSCGLWVSRELPGMAVLKLQCRL